MRGAGLIAGARGGLEHDPIGYLQTIVEMYAPGCDHSAFGPRQLAQKVSHIMHIRQEEAKAKMR